MRRNGRYDEGELLALGAVGKKAQRKAKELRDELPPAFAVSGGREKLKEVEILIDCGVGSIEYFVSGSDAPQRVNVGALLADLEPTIADITT